MTNLITKKLTFHSEKYAEYALNAIMICNTALECGKVNFAFVTLTTVVLQTTPDTYDWLVNSDKETFCQDNCTDEEWVSDWDKEQLELKSFVFDNWQI